jgi:hypothetical protein
MTGRKNVVPYSGQDRERLTGAQVLTPELATWYQGAGRVMTGAPAALYGPIAADRVLG